MNQLTIKIDLEDYTAGLFIKINANGFSGFGEGWFNISEIIGFCRELESLDLNSDVKCELVAGQSKSDGSEYIELIGIRCYVIANGLLGMHVSLTDYPYTDEVRNLMRNPFGSHDKYSFYIKDSISNINANTNQ